MYSQTPTFIVCSRTLSHSDSFLSQKSWGSVSTIDNKEHITSDPQPEPTYSESVLSDTRAFPGLQANRTKLQPPAIPTISSLTKLLRRTGLTTKTPPESENPQANIPSLEERTRPRSSIDFLKTRSKGTEFINVSLKADNLEQPSQRTNQILNPIKDLNDDIYEDLGVALFSLRRSANRISRQRFQQPQPDVLKPVLGTILAHCSEMPFTSHFVHHSNTSENSSDDPTPIAIVNQSPAIKEDSSHSSSSSEEEFEYTGHDDADDNSSFCTVSTMRSKVDEFEFCLPQWPTDL